MKKLNILFISVAFPPKFDSESLQAERVISELLKRKKIDISVVTAAPKRSQNMPASNGMEDFSQKVSSYFETSIIESQFLNKLLSVVGLINIPDAKWAFTLQSRNVLKNIPNSVDLVYSRSFPPSSSVLACRVAEKLGAPWLMHLSDPWLLNPTHRYSWVEKLVNRRLEKMCFEQADIVTFTTEQTMDLYKSYYPPYSSKFFLSYNSVASVDAKARHIDSVSSKKLRIIHAGLLNRSRNPDLFIQALRHIKSNDVDMLEKLEVVFVGPVDRYVNKQLESNKDMISYHGTIDYDESRKLISSADIVLSFDNEFDSDQSAVFLPSKLLDYAASRKRIICITNEGSPSSQFVREIGGNVFGHKSRAELIELIFKAVNMKKTGDTKFFNSLTLPERYNTSNVVDNLVEKFRRLVG